ETIQKYDLWLADYSGPPDYPCGIQQTGNTGSVPGIDGNVDLDVAMKDYPTIIKAGGYNGYPKPTILNFKSDTTMDIFLDRGGDYQLKVTAKSVPKVNAGTAGVVAVLPRYQSGDDHYFYIVAFGASGTATGIYVNDVKQFVAHVK
ncbi:MAG TPA: hypothetical protein GXX74_07645, partial [Clostridiales bacterium]|nr:hypothetical protein [Clostridiales bacterium]